MTMVIERIPRWRVGNVEVGDVAKETIREVGDDDVPGLAAEMAYHSILAVFPFLLFLAGLTAVVNSVFPVGDLTQRIVDKASKVMPDDAVSLIRSFTDELVHSKGTGAVVFGLVGAIWAASAAIGAAMKALNRAYDVKEDRGFLHRKLVAIGLTLMFGGFILAAALLIATGQFVARRIGEAFGWSNAIIMLYNWATLPSALVLVTIAVAVLYWLAPNTGHEFRWVTPGALLFVVGWVLASVAFAFYVSNFGAYNRTYGSIGAVIILLIWLYWSNLLLLIGGELNAVLARRHDPAYIAEEGAKPEGGGSRAQP